MKEVTAAELKEMLNKKENIQLIDVREAYEADIASLGADLIPMDEVMDNLDKISRDKKVIVHCRSGKRSGAVINALESQQGFTNLYNLKGGILAWINDIDPSMTKY
jgi:rhodanese-related sulfurtransferase